jgi:hypothetical protein
MARLRRALAPSEHVRRLRPGRSHVGARFRFRVNRAVPLEQPFGSSLSSQASVSWVGAETLASVEEQSCRPEAFESSGAPLRQARAAAVGAARWRLPPQTTGSPRPGACSAHFASRALE